jgi:signal transduction histidine kinase
MAFIAFIVAFTSALAVWFGTQQGYLTPLETYTLPVLSLVSLSSCIGYALLRLAYLRILDITFKATTGCFLVFSQIEAALYSGPNNLGFYMIWIASYYIMLMFADVRLERTNWSLVYFLLAVILVFGAFVIGPHAVSDLTGLLIVNLLAGQVVIVMVYRYVAGLIKRSAGARAHAKAFEDRATALSDAVEVAEAARQEAENAYKLAQEAQRQAEVAREEAERASIAKSSFVANMSHELRTPLNAIIGFSDLMQQDKKYALTDEKKIEYSRDIYASGQHLLSMVNDVLDMSKIEAGAFQIQESVFSLGEMAETVRGATRALARNGGINLDLSDLLETDTPSHPSHYSVRADRRLLIQMLINLLSNGIKYSHVGSSVGLSILKDADNQTVFKVTDTGIGMDETTVDNVIEPFIQAEDVYARNKGGTGLGLYLVDNMIKLHGGTMHIESEPGQGTIVTLTLPAERTVGNI